MINDEEHIVQDISITESDLYKQNKDHILFVDDREYNELRLGKNMYFSGNNVNSEVIRRILYHDNYYNYAYRFLNNDIDCFKIAYIKNGDIYNSISYEKSVIIEAIEHYLAEDENIPDKEKVVKKYSTLKSLISDEVFKNKYENLCFQINIERCNYNIQVKDIINLLSCETSEFENICDDENIKELYGIPKDHFIYATRYFLKKEKICQNYALSSNLKQNAIKIIEYYYDVEALNQYLETGDTLYQKISIDKNLEEEILKDIPKDFSKLEIAQYIYVKLCLLLTYDEEYQAFDQKGEVLKKHEDYKHVEKININNNKVTCYEFNLLYTNLLSKLGINFKTKYNMYDDESGYGKTHTELRYRVGKFLVFADSVEGIINGDIANSKVNKIVTGIRCLNSNKKTKDEFNNSLKKVCNYIYKDMKKEDLDELIKAYQEETDNIEEIPLNRRLEIFLDLLSNVKYKGVDAMAYALCLKRNIFTYVENTIFFKYNIICNRNTDNGDLAKLSLIIRYNEDRYITDYNTQYYLFTPFEKVSKISYEEVKKLFDDGIFSYLERDDNLIPGTGKREKR